MQVISCGTQSLARRSTWESAKAVIHRGPFFRLNPRREAPRAGPDSSPFQPQWPQWPPSASREFLRPTLLDLPHPFPGVWKLHAANLGAPEIKSGSFSVTAAETVTNFSLVLGAGAESPCGTGALTVRVLGAHHLVRDPLNDLGNPSNEYAISSPSDVIDPVKVSVTVNGVREAGALEIAFGPGSRGGASTGGDVYYNNNNCELFFGVAKG